MNGTKDTLGDKMRWLLLIGLFSIARAETDGRRIFQWARFNQAYIHDCLEYRDGGMYTTCCIENGTTLIEIPGEQYVRHDGSWPDIRDNIASRFLYPDEADPFFDYFDSVEVDCYSAICRPENMTFMGIDYLHDLVFDGEDVEPEMVMAASTAYSRIWDNPLWALVPVVDLINHGFNKTAVIIPSNKSFVVRTGKHHYHSGEQIYIDYGFNKTQTQDAFIYYGIENPEYVPTCDDYAVVRWRQFPEKRIECFSNISRFSLVQMEFEMMTAYHWSDNDMVMAARKWTELYWRNASRNAPKIPSP